MCHPWYRTHEPIWPVWIKVFRGSVAYLTSYLHLLSCEVAVYSSDGNPVNLGPGCFLNWVTPFYLIKFLFQFTQFHYPEINRQQVSQLSTITYNE